MVKQIGFFNNGKKESDYVSGANKGQITLNRSSFVNQLTEFVSVFNEDPFMFLTDQDVDTIRDLYARATTREILTDQELVGALAQLQLLNRAPKDYFVKRGCYLLEDRDI